MAVSLADPAVIYLGGGCGVLRSQDEGSTWVRVLEFYLAGVAVSLVDAKDVYAGNFRDGLWRSVDGGDSWTQVDSRAKVYGLRFDPRDPEQRALLAVTESDILWSPDGGESWTLLFWPLGVGGLPDSSNGVLIVEDQLLVAARGRGLWQTTLPPIP
jgi:photosystem II stability/assembly factor-like uncharacterized protein